MQRIGIYLADLDRDRTSSHGIINYALCAAREIAARLADSEEFFVLASAEIAGEISPLTDLSNVRLDVLPPLRSAVRRILRDQIHLQAWTRRRSLQAVLLPKGTMPFRWPGRPWTVASVHDNIVEAYASGALPSRGSWLKDRYFAQSIKRSLTTADRVATLTQSSAAALTKWVPQAAVSVAGMGLTLTSSISAAHEKLPRVLIFDSDLPHKRTDLAVELVGQTLTKYNHTDVELVLVGKGVGSEAARRLGLRHHVMEGPLSMIERDLLMQSSQLVVSASSYEGLGLTTLEAWGVGTPAIAARIDTTEESIGDIAPYALFDAEDVEAFSESFAIAIGSTPEEICRVSRAIHSRYSWSRTGDLIMEMLREGFER